MYRRTVLDWLGVAVGVSMTGCVDSMVASPDSEPNPSTNSTGTVTQSCDEYVYQSEADGAGELPWHLFIRNVGLDSHPVTISIREVSESTLTEVISCTAASSSHRELLFDLSADTEYRVTVTLNRSSGTETASTTVSGWNRVTGSNEALEVTVENGEFRIQRIHYDSGMPTKQNE